MIPEHHNEGGLRIVLEIMDQIFQCLVALVDDGEILVGGPVIVALHLDFSLVVFLGVAPVVLHGYVEQKQGIPAVLLGLHHINNFLEVGLVADVIPNLLIVFIEIVNGIEGVKIQKPVRAGPLPVGSLVRMHGYRVIALSLQGRHQGILIVSKIAHIGYHGGKTLHGISGKEFVLRLGGPSSPDAYQGMAFNGIFLHRIVERHDLLIGPQVAHHPVVRPGLAHNGNDVHRLDFAFVGVLGGIHALCDFLCLFQRIIRRRRQPHIFRHTEEAHGIAVFPVGGDGHPQIGDNAQVSVPVCIQVKEIAKDHESPHPQPDGDLSGLFPGQIPVRQMQDQGDQTEA